MDHEPVLITTLAVGLVAAFVGGLWRGAWAPLDRRLHRGRCGDRAVHAGTDRGPSDRHRTRRIGIILLMFGVGIEFPSKT